MIHYKDQFSSKHNFPVKEGATKVLIIASTPRSGSHMLGHALWQTGKCGFPLEYAQMKNMDEWKTILGTSEVLETLIEIQKLRTSSNGVFSIKLHYSHLNQFGGFFNLLNFYENPYFVFLKRSNILDQAISLAIARQTDVWIASDKKETNLPIYQFALVLKCMNELVLDQAAWQYYLAATGVRQIQVSYDNVKNNLKKTIHEIAAFIDEPIGDSLIPLMQITEQQGNIINDEWKKRFIANIKREKGTISEEFADLTIKFRNRIRKIID